MTRTILRTPACGLLGCDYPLVLAGMGGVARSELVAAVTAAGGFGFLGMVREPVRLIEAQVASVRAAGHERFGVNLIPAATEPALLAAHVQGCIDLRVPVVGLFWDVDAGTVRRLRDAGIVVVYQVGSAADARAAEKAGAQLLIAQGVEAGGHVRAARPLAETLSQVLAATSLPVLAAGGLSDGTDVATVMGLGADGAVIGTAMIATEEAFAHDHHKRRLLAAKAEDTVLTEAFHINWPPGAPVRVLRSAVTDGERGDAFHSPAATIGEDDGRPIRLFSTDSPLRTTRGDLEAMALYAGMGVGKVDRIVPARERIAEILDAASAALSAVGPDSERIEVSSSVCYADEVGAEYMGMLGREALHERLSDLVDALRAAVRVELRQSGENECRWRGSYVRWAWQFARLLERRGGTPTQRLTGDVLTSGPTSEGIAREIEARVRSLFPLVADECVRTPLSMLLAELDVRDRA